MILFDLYDTPGFASEFFGCCRFVILSGIILYNIYILYMYNMTVQDIMNYHILNGRSKLLPEGGIC